MFINASDENIEVNLDWDRTPLNLMESVSMYPVALMGDVLQRIGMMSSAIHHVAGESSFYGNIFPILTREGDNLAIHRALDEAKPGDVLVINGNSETNRAVFGDILGELCLAKKIAAVVIDGATRDVEELTTMGLPVFARAINPAGPSKYGPGVIGAPIACGNVVCNPGDAIFGDRDGVIVVSRKHLPTIADKLAKQEMLEADLRKRIRNSVVS